MNELLTSMIIAEVLCYALETSVLCCLPILIDDSVLVVHDEVVVPLLLQVGHGAFGGDIVDLGLRVVDIRH